MMFWALYVAAVGGIQVGKRVFITKGVNFEGGMTLEAGDVGVTRREADAEGHYEVEIKGFLVDAPARVLEVLPDLKIGNKVELSPDIKYDGVNYYDRHQTAVIRRIAHNANADIQYVRDNVYASVPISYLIPECYGRGTRGNSERCLCRDPYSGPLCLSVQAPSVMSMVTNFIASVTNMAPPDEGSEEGQVPTGPMMVSNLMWGGHIYDSIIEADVGVLKEVLSSATYTLLLSCSSWERLCSPALDTLSSVSLDGSEGVKDPRLAQECYDTDAVPIHPNGAHIRKVFIDSMLINKPSSGPYLMLLKGKSLFKEYIGDMTNKRKILKFIENAFTGHLDAAGTAELLLDNDVVVVVDSSHMHVHGDGHLRLDGIVNALDVPYGIWNKGKQSQVHQLQQLGLDVKGDTKETSIAVFLKDVDKAFIRVTYEGAPSVNRVWEWVQTTAVPMVTVLTQYNFGSVIERVRARRGAIAILSRGSPREFRRAASAHHQGAQEHTITYCVLELPAGSELLKRFGHGDYIIAIPHLELVHWSNVLPATYEEAEAIARTYTGLPSGVVRSRGRQEVECTANVLSMNEGDLYGLPTHPCSLPDVLLLVVRTTWCWHCRRLVPLLPDIGTALAEGGHEAIVVDHVADDTIFPPWLSQHIRGYPEILLVRLDTTGDNVTRYEGTRTISSLVSFASGADVSLKTPESALTARQQTYRRNARSLALKRRAE
eukprot:TRINITY_DN6223_c0_g1_i1.p1 TRINITY_DN6223_c0_g1~~TRINITY_DN6223_c0_g1_i1.p1  ORF type:complete len:714 (+),score=150.69 TRINITY_DN6223_c0_g1_i1:41-2182(+)